MAKEIPPKLSDVFGFQQSVKGGLGFIEQNSLFYLAGKQGVHPDLKRDRHQFTTLPEENEVTAVGFGSNNLLLFAVKGKKPLVSIFDLKTNKKKTLSCADKVMSHSYVCVCFSEDGVRVGAQGGPPDWAFVLWNLKKERLETVFHPFRMEPGAKIYKFAFCPIDSKLIVAVGRYFLREYRCKDGKKIQETPLHESERSNTTFHCAAWIQCPGHVVVGTSDGRILVFKSMQLVQQVDVTEALERMQKGMNVDDRNITCIVVTADGLLCSHGCSSILSFKQGFKLHKVLNIQNSSNESRVVQLTLNLQEDTVGIATKDGRIFTYSFVDRHQDRDCEDTFRLLQDFQHTERVNHAVTLPSVSLHASCSESRIILRDFSSRLVFLRAELSAAPSSLTVCPLATSLAMGLEGAVKVFNIVMDALVEAKCFDVSTHPQVSYSPGSHLLAFTDDNVIRLCYSIGFKELTSFKSHIAKVNTLLWRNDHCLLSADEDGEIYEWNIPLKIMSWKLSVPDVIHKCIVTPRESHDAYAAGTDGKIRRVKDGEMISSCSPNVSGISAMSVLEQWLLVGGADGKILGLNLSLSATNFQVQCQIGRIIHLAVLPDTESVMATDEYGVVSTWSFRKEKSRESFPSREVVLIDLDKQRESIQCVEDLEEELKHCTQQMNDRLDRQKKELQEVEAEASEEYRKIEISLRDTAQKLKEELEKIKASSKENYLNKKQIIEKEREENEKDFLEKMAAEEKNLQIAKEERLRIEQDFEDTVSQKTKEKQATLEDFQAKYSRNLERLQGLKSQLAKEEANAAQAVLENEMLDRSLEKEKGADHRDLIVGQETYSDMKIKKEMDRHISEMGELESQFSYHKECYRSIEDAFKTKHRVIRSLQDVTEKIKDRVNQVREDISRIDNVLTTKSEFSQELEGAAEELSAEGNQKIEECEEEIRLKTHKLQELKNQLQKSQEIHRALCAKLKVKRREETVLSERLQSTENSVTENTRKLTTSQLLLERYRMEFVNSTSECPSATALRWAMVRLYEKRVVKPALKEESVFFADTDPYVRFCKQRDHYEALINVVRSRTSQIKNTFRENFLKLAKENSDWSAFAEALRADIRQKQERIRCLEEGLGLAAEEFGKDHEETQRRLWQTAERLSHLKEEEDRQIEQRLTLIKEQQEEILRLHGLLSVEDKGKIIRKMR